MKEGVQTKESETAKAGCIQRRKSWTKVDKKEKNGGV